MPPSRRKRRNAASRRYQHNNASPEGASIETSRMPFPSEIIHMVCRYLLPPQVAHVRLACKALARIGAEYLLPIIHLQLTVNSYCRLGRIVDHPIFSQYVYEIQYDCDFVKDMSWEDFKKFRITGKKEKSYFLDEQRHIDYEKSQFRSAEECEKFEKGKLQAAYQVHQSLVAEQNLLRRIGFFHEFIADLLLRLPRLQRLRTGEIWNHDRFLAALQVALDRPSAESVLDVRGDWYWPCGLSYRGLDSGLSGPITATLLQGLGCGRPVLQVLDVPHLDWLVFNLTNSGFSLMTNALYNLRRLKTKIIGPKVRRVEGDREYGEFTGCLRKKWLHKFLASCPNLVDLDLSWCENFSDPKLDLRHWLGSFHWQALTNLSLGDFEVSPAMFIAFLARHSASLQRLTLRDISLTEGTWYPTLIEMRKVLRLKEASVSGVFDLGDWDEHNTWHMYPCPEYQEDKQPYGDFIKEYLEDHSGQEMRLDILMRDGHV